MVVVCYSCCIVLHQTPDYISTEGLERAQPRAQCMHHKLDCLWSQQNICVNSDYSRKPQIMICFTDLLLLIKLSEKDMRQKTVQMHKKRIV